MNRSRCILVIGSTDGGHHTTYFKKVVRGLSSSGFRVVAGSHTSSGQQAFFEELRREDSVVGLVSAQLPDECSIYGRLVSSFRRELSFRRFYAGLYKQAVEHFQVESVLLLSFDSAINATALCGSPFGSAFYSGIVMRQSFHFARLGISGGEAGIGGRAKHLLFNRVLRQERLKAVFTIDPTLTEHYSARDDVRYSKIKYLADPVDAPSIHDRAEARARYGWPSHGTIVLLYGAVDARKGLAELIDFLRSSACPVDIFAAVVGVQSESAKALAEIPIAQELVRGGKLAFINRYVSDEEEGYIFSASDIVWLVYRDFPFMSGVLIKAGTYGKKVVLGDSGLISWFARRLRANEDFERLGQYEVLKTQRSAAMFSMHCWEAAVRLIASEA